MNTIDLHIHTTCSDGSLTPAEMVALAAGKKLQVIAITDHNTVSGIEEAIICGKANRVTVIPGIEFTITDFHYKTHLLAYGIEYQHPLLLQALKKYKLSRHKSIIIFMKKMRESGIDVSEELIRSRYGRLSFKNIAKFLCATNVVSSVDEAFSKYINKEHFSPSKPGFLLKETLELIKTINGIAVLAHPFTISTDMECLDESIGYLKKQGLQGLECYYSHYDAGQIAILVKLAEKHSLFVTGGSDYHGEWSNGIEMGSGKGDLVVPQHVLTPFNL
ncbi:PHP domain-containing protein [Paenibacillus sp. FSL R7-0331]|uniref:PHP domain-containing protein n=1 Tax=Paenibacillus sp. FSL R7-0331 TaxID=1536773 RepID=UPI0004F6C40C|nr:PHP domain-containing protein [Paenibacillus sp. FSL R7-0331]AIQ51309.1 hypothetical protein R70331_07155 [Paenibacillus sp. FSL R7-0331]